MNMWCIISKVVAKSVRFWVTISVKSNDFTKLSLFILPSCSQMEQISSTSSMVTDHGQIILQIWQMMAHGEIMWFFMQQQTALTRLFM